MIDLRYSALPFQMSEAVLLELQRELPALTRYPDPAYAELKALLAQDAGAGPENISLGNGADDLIDQLCKALPGTFWIPTPAFSEFERAARRNSKPTQLMTCLNGGRMDLQPLLSQDLQGVVVWLSNPSNPTGGAYEIRQLRQVVDAGATLVLDEAYGEFAPLKEAEWLSQPSVIRLRTFSKALGLPGLRLGYAIADASLVRRLEQVRPFFPVNGLAVGAARSLPILRKQAMGRIRQIAQIRADFTSRIQASGLDVLPSQANFVLIDFETKEGTQAALDCLGDASIRVLPPWDEEFTGLPDRYLRIVIGSASEMEQVADILEKSKRGD